MTDLPNVYNNMLKWFETGAKLKKVMLAKKLRIAKCKCPHCEHGFIMGTLGGSKNHLHMKCDSCPVMLME